MSFTADRESVTSEGDAAVRHFGGPLSDMAMLGGASLLLLPLIALLPEATMRPGFVTATFLLAMVINYPHFMVSYRIFYEDFGRKRTPGSHGGTSTLHLRYLFAGVAVPVALIAAMLVPIVRGDAQMLGHSYNAMGFFVGWHYVKQGYGIAMADAAFKGRFFASTEKQLLLFNGYIVWITSWLVRNERGGSREFLGIDVRLFDVATPILWLGSAATLVSTVAVVGLLARRAIQGQPTAWAGVLGYLAALYAWRLFVRFDPLVILVVPALHSLQYLWVVRRYQHNRHRVGAAPRSWWGEYRRSVVLGLLGFLVIPTLLDVTIPVDDSLGAVPFSFLFLVGINVHHYFLDNVMWRRENPEISTHLFAVDAGAKT